MNLVLLCISVFTEHLLCVTNVGCGGHGSCPLKSDGHKNITGRELQIIIIAEIKYSSEGTSILIEGWEFFSGGGGSTFNQCESHRLIKAHVKELGHGFLHYLYVETF